MSDTGNADKPDNLRLFHVANGQSGYFTAEQAHACGYSRALLSYHAKTGRFERIKHGLYRIQQYPSSPREHVLAAWLAVGKDIAVVSHESALELLDLSDIIPFYTHLTVSRSQRSIPNAPGVKIHTTMIPISRSELAFREGMVITNATRSILDSAEYGSMPDQIEMAVVQAVERGLVRPDRLRKQAESRSRRVASLISQALAEAA